MPKSSFHTLAIQLIIWEQPVPEKRPGNSAPVELALGLTYGIGWVLSY